MKNILMDVISQESASETNLPTISLESYLMEESISMESVSNALFSLENDLVILGELQSAESSLEALYAELEKENTPDSMWVASLESRLGMDLEVSLEGVGSVLKKVRDAVVNRIARINNGLSDVFRDARKNDDDFVSMIRDLENRVKGISGDVEKGLKMETKYVDYIHANPSAEIKDIEKIISETTKAFGTVFSASTEVMLQTVDSVDKMDNAITDTIKSGAEDVMKVNKTYEQIVKDLESFDRNWIKKLKSIDGNLLAGGYRVKYKNFTTTSGATLVFTDKDEDGRDVTQAYIYLAIEAVNDKKPKTIAEIEVPNKAEMLKLLKTFRDHVEVLRAEKEKSLKAWKQLLDVIRRPLDYRGVKSQVAAKLMSEMAVKVARLAVFTINIATQASNKSLNHMQSIKIRGTRYMGQVVSEMEKATK